MNDMNNSTDPSAGGGGDDENVVNWVALVVSLVALLGTVAQVLQQYYSSAAGYSNCGESVMGKWHESKQRKFRPAELRFEVLFETPVFFVCPRSNDKGPIPDTPIHFVDGTPKSLDETRALLAKEEAATLRQKVVGKAIHTADNERASWVTMLSHLQTMEKESYEWQQTHSKTGSPHSQPLAGSEQHTLVVALQAKRRSWDTMPSGVKKPYATTTMCHLLEIAAMMGIYWKEFDRSRERYRAEGNGYLLSGVHVPELGPTFTLYLTGQSRFEENRVIPVDEVKELCCGYVSTLFHESNIKNRRRIEFPNGEANDLQFLQLGSIDEIAETMVSIECNTDTAKYFRSADAKHTHLFPGSSIAPERWFSFRPALTRAVPFELMGMLGKTLHIRNTAFRMLPNPTPYHWDKNFFNLRKLVKEYGKKINDSEIDLPTEHEQIRQLILDTDTLVDALGRDRKSGTPGYFIPLLNTLHDMLDGCDAFLRHSDRKRDLVRMVVREHFQEVMKLINDRSDVDSDDRGMASSEKGLRAEHFDELTAASPELRQEVFMELYFFKVLDQVRERAVVSYTRQRTTRYAPSIMHSREGSINIKFDDDDGEPLRESPPSHHVHSPTVSLSPTSPSSLHAPFPSAPPPFLQAQASSGPSIHVEPPPGHGHHKPNEFDPTTMLDAEAAAIWCTLVFRMLCWLLLHDFNKKDVQMAKSELLGSRLPVYIT